MKSLTKELIKSKFKELNIDDKFFNNFEHEVRRVYGELQTANPNDNPEESNVDASIRSAKEYMAFYVAEIRKGHRKEWAHSFALDSMISKCDVEKARNALDAIEDETEKEKELIIHAWALKPDLHFLKCYKFLFYEGEEGAYNKAVAYTEAYHRCIDNGKSEIYAHAYANASIFDAVLVAKDPAETYYDLYAEAFELAVKHGMNEVEAHFFCDSCAMASDWRYLCNMEGYLKQFHEAWQIDYYKRLSCNSANQDKSLTKEEKRKIINDVSHMYAKYLL